QPAGTGIFARAPGRAPASLSALPGGHAPACRAPAPRPRQGPSPPAAASTLLAGLSRTGGGGGRSGSLVAPALADRGVAGVAVRAGAEDRRAGFGQARGQGAGAAGLNPGRGMSGCPSLISALPHSYYACRMVSHARPAEDSLAVLKARRDTLSPPLGQALDAFACVDDGGVAECREVLDLLKTLGCDDETLAAALWFYVAQASPATWKQAEPRLPATLARLVGGQLAAERVWELHAEHRQG